jgi:hypothetical protein
VLLRRRLAVLVATASIAVMMLLVMAPMVMAAPGMGRSPFAPPPGAAPGTAFRDPTANEHDQCAHQTGPMGCR